MTAGRPRSPGRTRRDGARAEAAPSESPERDDGAKRDGNHGNGATKRPAELRTVISSARAQLQELTGRPAEAVTSVEKVEDGWRLSVEVVELQRIPGSTSILGGYDVLVDQDGNLLEYVRTSRYHRNQAGEADQ